MNESARPKPVNCSRTEGAKSAAAPPYAPSMWNQSARSSATSATPSRSSTIPALVVPAVATTPITSDARGSSRSAVRSASPVRRWLRTGTGNVSTPRTWQALPTDEWASSLMAISGRRGASARRRCAVVSRATMSAERLPAEPPATKHPPAPGGRPACRDNTPSAWFSATTTPAASSQEVPWSDEQDTNMSKRSDALVGAAGMNERKRGLSQETTAKASFSVHSFSTWAGSLPSGPIRPASSASREDTRPPKSSDTGSMERRSRQASTIRSVMAGS